MYQKEGNPEWSEVPADGHLTSLEPQKRYFYYAYAVTATYPMTVGATMEFTTPLCSDVALADNMVMIYPNPASEELKIVVEGLTSDAEATILDIQGKVVGRYTIDANLGRTKIDVSGFTDGTYMVRIASQDFNRVERLIIKR